IDGYSQPGSSPNTLATGDNAVILVALDGGGQNADGLVLSNASKVTIRGLAVGGFGNGNVADAGIHITGSGSAYDTVVGDFLGLLADGVTPNPNSDGVLIDSGSNHDVIGGANPSDRNVLSGNASQGVNLSGSSTTQNTIEGNYIGVDAHGATGPGNRIGV